MTYYAVAAAHCTPAGGVVMALGADLALAPVATLPSSGAALAVARALNAVRSGLPAAAAVLLSHGADRPDLAMPAVRAERMSAEQWCTLGLPLRARSVSAPVLARLDDPRATRSPAPLLAAAGHLGRTLARHAAPAPAAAVRAHVAQLLVPFDGVPLLVRATGPDGRGVVFLANTVAGQLEHDELERVAAGDGGPLLDPVAGDVLPLTLRARRGELRVRAHPDLFRAWLVAHSGPPAAAP